MDIETKNEVMKEVVSDYLDSMLPTSLTKEMLDQERANRIYLAVTTQPEGILWQGIRDRVRGIDAMCARLGRRHVARIGDDELISESLDKCLLPFCSDPSSVHDRFRWGLAFLRGHNLDARTIWTGRTPDDAFTSLVMATTDKSAAHYLTLQVFERHARHDFPEPAMRCAVRLGLVDWSESFVNERMESAFSTMLDAVNDTNALPALLFTAKTACLDSPDCSICRAALCGGGQGYGCWFLNNGFS